MRITPKSMIGQKMSNAGANKRAKNLASGLLRKKKQFRLGAQISIVPSAEMHREMQITASWAVSGKFENKSRSLIDT